MCSRIIKELFLFTTLTERKRQENEQTDTTTELLSSYTETRFSGGRRAFMQAYPSSVPFGDEMGRNRAFHREGPLGEEHGSRDRSSSPSSSRLGRDSIPLEV